MLRGETFNLNAANNPTLYADPCGEVIPLIV